MYTSLSQHNNQKDALRNKITVAAMLAATAVLLGAYATAETNFTGSGVSPTFESCVKANGFGSVPSLVNIDRAGLLWLGERAAANGGCVSVDLVATADARIQYGSQVSSSVSKTSRTTELDSSTTTTTQPGALVEVLMGAWGETPDPAARNVRSSGLQIISSRWNVLDTTGDKTRYQNPTDPISKRLSNAEAYDHYAVNDSDTIGAYYLKQWSDQYTTETTTKAETVSAKTETITRKRLFCPSQWNYVYRVGSEVYGFSGTAGACQVKTSTTTHDLGSSISRSTNTTSVIGTSTSWTYIDAPADPE